MTVSLTLFCLASLIREGKSSAAIGTFSASRAVPAFPGATNTRSTRSLWAIFHVRACSLPPLPTISTFMLKVLEARGEKLNGA